MATPCNPPSRYAQNDKNKPKARFACHTEALAEVSTNLKHEFVLLKYGFFILHLKRILNFMDFSLSSESSK